MSEEQGAQEPPKIEFPCDYPIKVMGRQVDDFHAVVMEVFERHAPGFDRDGVSVRDSSKGTFMAITVVIEATGKDQLDALHKDLMATGLVNMVL